MKRRLLMILLLLVAGAIVNVAVAWGCNRYIEPASNHPSPIHNASWPVQVPADWPKVCTAVRESGFGVSERNGSVGTDTAFYFASRREAGIPMRLMVGDSWEESNQYAVTQRSFRSPFTILWPGFAFNTVFYAAVLWGVFATPFVQRRSQLIKRGLLYTECGATHDVKP